MKLMKDCLVARIGRKLCVIHSPYMIRHDGYAKLKVFWYDRPSWISGEYNFHCLYVNYAFHRFLLVATQKEMITKTRGNTLKIYWWSYSLDQAQWRTAFCLKSSEVFHKTVSTKFTHSSFLLLYNVIVLS